MHLFDSPYGDDVISNVAKLQSAVTVMNEKVTDYNTKVGSSIMEPEYAICIATLTTAFYRDMNFVELNFKPSFELLEILLDKTLTLVLHRVEFRITRNRHGI